MQSVAKQPQKICAEVKFWNGRETIFKIEFLVFENDDAKSEFRLLILCLCKLIAVIYLTITDNSGWLMTNRKLKIGTCEFTDVFTYFLNQRF